LTQEYSEELTWVESEDGIRLYGAVVRPSGRQPKPPAIIHIPGWDVNFAHPLHLLTSRELASHGYLSVLGSTRGWPFGEIAVAQGGYKMIGAGWERLHEAPLDLGAWIRFAGELGLDSCVLLGHSLGSVKSVFYQAERQDPRLAGVICASPGPLEAPAIDASVLTLATIMVAEGRGRDLLPWGSYGGVATLSAQTCADYAPEQWLAFDVFGLRSERPAVSRIRTPLLAFYGTEHDIGGEQELALIRRSATAARRVDTQLFSGANHSYEGYEPQVGRAIAHWLDTVVGPH
jgi:dienelactone hydrolase